jgi:hypothetical protein
VWNGRQCRIGSSCGERPPDGRGDQGHRGKDAAFLQGAARVVTSTGGVEGKVDAVAGVTSDSGRAVARRFVAPYPMCRRMREEARLYDNAHDDFFAPSRFDDVERCRSARPDGSTRSGYDRPSMTCGMSVIDLRLELQSESPAINHVADVCRRRYLGGASNRPVSAIPPRGDGTGAEERQMRQSTMGESWHRQSI